MDKKNNKKVRETNIPASNTNKNKNMNKVHGQVFVFCSI